MALLPPSLVKHDGHRIGEIQAPVSRPHGNEQTLSIGQGSQEIRGQAPRLRAENQGIARLKLDSRGRKKGRFTVTAGAVGYLTVKKKVPLAGSR